MKALTALLLMFPALAHAAALEFKELTKNQEAAVDATIVTTDFPFTNTSDKPVTITDSDPGCTCLTVEVSGGKLKYQPGESGVIRTTFNVENNTGDVEKNIAIWLNDDPKSKPSVHLKVNFHIPILVNLEPKTLSWDIGGKVEAKTIHIKMAEGSTINVLNVNAKDSFKTELNTLEKGREYELVVTPKSVDGPDLSVIRIETDSRISKQKVQQAFAVVRKPVVKPQAAKE
ncbi:MAG: DUF1573 domain-containing protein [Verrucomicrobiota bacterium]